MVLRFAPILRSAEPPGPGRRGPDRSAGARLRRRWLRALALGLGGMTLAGVLATGMPLLAQTDGAQSPPATAPLRLAQAQAPAMMAPAMDPARAPWQQAPPAPPAPRAGEMGDLRLPGTAEGPAAPPAAPLAPPPETARADVPPPPPASPRLPPLSRAEAPPVQEDVTPFGVTVRPAPDGQGPVARSDQRLRLAAALPDGVDAPPRRPGTATAAAPTVAAPTVAAPAQTDPVPRPRPRPETAETLANAVAAAVAATGAPGFRVPDGTTLRPRPRPADMAPLVARSAALAPDRAPAPDPAPDPAPAQGTGDEAEAEADSAMADEIDSPGAGFLGLFGRSQPPAVRRSERIAPDAPTPATVSRKATERNALSLGETALVGIFGTAEDRRALVRLENGRYVKVEVGDRLDGGKVLAISETELRYEQQGRVTVLRMPRG